MSNNGYCPSCGTEQILGQDFCPSCDRTFVIRDVTEAYCPSCGSLLISTENPCPNCKRKFVIQEVQRPTEPATPTEPLPPQPEISGPVEPKTKNIFKHGGKKHLEEEEALFIKAGESMANESEQWYRQCLSSLARDSVTIDGEGIFRVRLIATTYVGTAFIARRIEYEYIAVVTEVTSMLSAVALKPFLENPNYPVLDHDRAKVMGNILVQSATNAMLSELAEPSTLNHQTDGLQTLIEEYRIAFEGSLALGELTSEVFNNDYLDPIRMNIEASMNVLSKLMRTNLSLKNLNDYVSSELLHRKITE